MRRKKNNTEITPKKQEQSHLDEKKRTNEKFNFFSPRYFVRFPEIDKQWTIPHSIHAIDMAKRKKTPKTFQPHSFHYINLGDNEKATTTENENSGCSKWCTLSLTCNIDTEPPKKGPKNNQRNLFQFSIHSKRKCHSVSN